MQRFWIALYLVTAVAHAPFALGLAWALSRAGLMSSGLAALAASIIALAIASLLRGRVRRARADAPIPRSRLLLIEEPFYIHWCGAVASTPLFILLALAAL